MTTAGILGTLTVTYGRMTSLVDGVYNTGIGSNVLIPPGPGEGIYGNVDSALNALISNAASEVSGIQSSYPTQSGNLNSNFTDMAASLNREKTNLSLATIDIGNLPTTGRLPVMSFVQNLPTYGLTQSKMALANFSKL